jgi:hypothetical protein
VILFVINDEESIIKINEPLIILIFGLNDHEFEKEKMI